MDAKTYIKQQEERDLELLNFSNPGKEEEKSKKGKTREAILKEESSSEEEDN
jgi:hypothetical protein